MGEFFYHPRKIKLWIVQVRNKLVWKLSFSTNLPIHSSHHFKNSLQNSLDSPLQIGGWAERICNWCSGERECKLFWNSSFHFIFTTYPFLRIESWRTLGIKNVMKHLFQWHHLIQVCSWSAPNSELSLFSSFLWLNIKLFCLKLIPTHRLRSIYLK